MWIPQKQLNLCLCRAKAKSGNLIYNRLHHALLCFSKKLKIRTLKTMKLVILKKKKYLCRFKINIYYSKNEQKTTLRLVSS